MATRLHFLLLALWSLLQIDLPLVLGQQSNWARELGILAQAPPEFGWRKRWRFGGSTETKEVLKCILDLLQKLLEQWPDPNGPWKGTRNQGDTCLTMEGLLQDLFSLNIRIFFKKIPRNLILLYKITFILIRSFLTFNFRPSNTFEAAVSL